MGGVDNKDKIEEEEEEKERRRRGYIYTGTDMVALNKNE